MMKFGFARHGMEENGKLGAPSGEQRSRFRAFFSKCLDPDNARLYGSFDQRTSLNITQFPKIQGSLLIRMGIVYPMMSYLVEKIGIPKEATTELVGVAINWHTYVAGYLAYLFEIELGLSKYPIELIQRGIMKLKDLAKPNDRPDA
jgi:hypothetical protein